MSSFARAKNLRGGTLIFGKKQLEFKRMGLKSREMYFEICVVNIKLGSDKVIIILLYRPSNPKSDQKLEKYFEDIEKSITKIQEQFGPEVKILNAGDMYIDLLKSDTKAARLKNTLKNYVLHLINSTPTRVTSSSKTLIDHVFANFKVDQNSVKTASVIFSDHEAVILDLPFSIKN
jgi:exonuclease III